MQTSKPRASQALRGLGALLAIAACAVLLNTALHFAISPYGNSTQIIWWSYRNVPKKSLDTVMVGSSFGLAAFDAPEVDKALGSKSFNLASTSQSLMDTYGILSTVIPEQEPRRVILGVEYSTMRQGIIMQASAPLLYERTEGQPPLQRLASYGRWVTRPDTVSKTWSLSYFFPWAFNHVDYTPDAIAANIRRRLACPDPVEAGKDYSPTWHYQGQGFFEVEGNVDYDTMGNTLPPIGPDDDVAFMDFLWPSLEQVADYCSQTGTQLYVVAMPQPAFNIVRYGDAYPQNMRRLQEVVEEHGATFVDFSLARPDVCALQDEDFSDNEHVNDVGARKFSEALGEAILRIEQGEQAGDLWYTYDGWDDWLSSIDRVLLVGCKGSVSPDGRSVLVDAWSYAGKDVTAEYEVSLVHEDGTTEVIRPYDTLPSATYPIEGHGTATFRVDARRAGSEGAPQRSATVVVAY